MVRVRVIALSTPVIPRHCPRCQSTRPFASSDRFRVNAQKKRLDVWLVYRCRACDFTWNREVLSRASVGEVPAARLSAFHANDRETAWRCAFSTPGEVAWRAEASGPFDGELILEMPFPCAARLDRVLGGAFGWSRGEIARRFAGAKALSRPARDGQHLVGLAEAPATP